PEAARTRIPAFACGGCVGRAGRAGSGRVLPCQCSCGRPELDNQKLVPQPHVPPVIVLENHGLRWVPKDKNLVMWRDWEESRQMVGALLEGRAHQHLVDFDCHLDDIREDWTNQQLNAQITQWVGPTNGNT
uniref:ER membrane protein complex subunit 9 n=1 Tax=Ovis aries TaxID=9940 RepID=A0AC11E4R1_SHEEP